MQIAVKKKFAILEMVVIFIGLPLLYKFDFIPVHKSIPLLSVFLIYLFKKQLINGNIYRTCIVWQHDFYHWIRRIFLFTFKSL